MSDYDAAWESLLVTATVGTERRPAAAREAPGQLGALLAQLDWSDAEGALLGAAAATSIGVRAGRLPPAHAGVGVPTCPPDEQREPSQTAAQHLALMLSGQHRAALPEWLGRLAALGLRAPADQLPALLELGHSQAGIRPHVLPAVGRRGQWLASLNPAWWYAIAGDAGAPEDLWETGSRAERVAALRTARAAEPAAGRGLLASTWKTEKADDRAAFLAELRGGLSLEDEPFLEAALDDRSKEARAAAADLLCRLPESQLAGRMERRLEPLVRWLPAERPSLLGLRLGRGPRIDVRLPEACDKAMARDGVEARAQTSGLGERAWWLAQMVAAVPPARWAERWSSPPEAIVRAALDHEHADALLSGWWAAADRHPDAAWAEALLTHAAGRALAPIGDSGQAGTRLAAQLPAERLERLAIESLADGPGRLPLLAGGGPWSAALTRAAVRSLQGVIRRGALSVWHSNHLLQLIGERAAPELHAELAEGWPRDAKQWPQWEGYVERCRELVEFRYHALRALEE